LGRLRFASLGFAIGARRPAMSSAFASARRCLLGKDAPGLSASTISRLKEMWGEEHERDLSARRYVYVWAHGIYLQARLDDEKQCILVLIGATPEGRKELIGFTDGAGESSQGWQELLLDLKRRGLAAPPSLAVADGALGFWKAIGELWPTTTKQRCWVHKTANVLNRLPKSQQSKAKRGLQDIWMAATRKDADGAFDAFLAAYTLKFEKASACLEKDRQALLAFYDFPAEHWKHLRTWNAIESTFDTVCDRTIRAKGCLSRGRRWPLSSISSRLHRKVGDGSTGTTSCRRSCSVPSSPTGWRSQPMILSPKPPPEPQASRTFDHGSMMNEQSSVPGALLWKASPQ
jgi:hypothetical protein